MPFSIIKNGVKYYLTHDQVGSLRAITDATGTVVKRIDYDFFGNIISDSDTNLVRFGYRDYMPETGRWTAKDPIGFAGGDVDLYGYTSSDPINFLDPLGLAVCPNNQDKTNTWDRFINNFDFALKANHDYFYGSTGKILKSIAEDLIAVALVNETGAVPWKEGFHSYLRDPYAHLPGMARTGIAGLGAGELLFSGLFVYGGKAILVGLAFETGIWGGTLIDTTYQTFFRN